MHAFFLDRRPVAVFLEVEVPGQVVRVQAVGRKFGGQHPHVAHRVLDGIDVGLVAGDDPYVPVTAVGALFHGNHAGHRAHAVHNLLKIHIAFPSLLIRRPHLTK